jgi:CubicO group peptidase (beta-lactamase class C family)
VLAGVAVERGLIRSIDDPVRDYSLDDGFTSPQNRDITWRHLLDQTSEWEGTLFDKPTPSTDTARSAPAPAPSPRARIATCSGPGRTGNTTTSA